VQVYPNPFIGKLTLYTNQSNLLQITVSDVLGRQVYQTTQQEEGGVLELDFSGKGLKGGLYLIRLQGREGGGQLIRVLKQ
jgi:hypothetical protein